MTLELANTILGIAASAVTVIAAIVGLIAWILSRRKNKRDKDDPPAGKGGDDTRQTLSRVVVIVVLLNTLVAGFELAPIFRPYNATLASAIVATAIILGSIGALIAARTTVDSVPDGFRIPILFVTTIASLVILSAALAPLAIGLIGVIVVLTSGTASTASVVAAVVSAFLNVLITAGLLVLVWGIMIFVRRGTGRVQHSDSIQSSRVPDDKY